MHASGSVIVRIRDGEEGFSRGMVVDAERVDVSIHQLLHLPSFDDR